MKTALFTIGSIILAIMVIAIIVNYILYSRNEKKKSPARKAFDAARREYQSNISEKKKELSRVKRKHSNRIGGIERDLARAVKYGDSPLAKIRGKEGKFSVTAFHLLVPNGRFDLNANIKGYVDTAGNIAVKSRSTLTRIGGGGLLFGKVGALVGASAKKSKVIDSRELYLFLEGDDFAAALTLKADQGAQAHRFLETVIHASKRVEAERATKDQMVAANSAILAEAKADTSEIEQARRALTKATNDTGAIEQARLQLEGDETADELPLADPLYRKKWVWGVIALALLAMVIGARQPSQIPASDNLLESPSIESTRTTSPTTSHSTTTDSASSTDVSEMEENEESVGSSMENSRVMENSKVEDVVSEFEAFINERSNAGVVIAQTVTDVSYEDGTVAIVFDPAAAGIDRDTFDSINPFDNLAEFAGVPIAFDDEIGNRLRQIVTGVQTSFVDGTDAGYLSSAELYRMGAGRELPDN